MTVPATEPMRIWHLMTHTSGLTYGFHWTHPVDAMYRNHGFEWGTPPRFDLAACCDAWAGLPLLFQPGSEWNYSVATDVLGRVVEVVSGMSLDRFFAERIFEPLGMADTGFSVPEPDHHRLAALYTPDPQTGRALRNEHDGQPGARAADRALRRRRAGVHGADYHRFMQMLLRRRRARRRATARPAHRALHGLATTCPAAPTSRRFGRPLFSETTFDGVGFGLGFSVVMDPVANKSPASVGRVRVGRRGQHRVLGRPRRAHDRAVPHPAAAVQHVSAALAAAPARAPGAPLSEGGWEPELEEVRAREARAGRWAGPRRWPASTRRAA